MDIFLTLLINGLSEGAITFLIAIGLSIIMGMMDVVNFCHGALFVWGAYGFVWAFNGTGSFMLGLFAAMVIAGALGFLIEKVFIARIYKKHSAQIVLTLGLSIILVEVVRLVWGITPIVVKKPALLSGVTIANGVTISHYRVFIILVGLIFMVLFFVTLKKTKIGMIIRAGVQRPDMVEALGINIRAYFTLVFVAGAALAGLGGALYAPMVGALDSAAGDVNQITAIIVLIIGGMGDIMGTAYGSIFIGLLDGAAAWFLPAMSIFANAIIMALVLTLKPRGLFKDWNFKRLLKGRDAHE